VERGQEVKHGPEWAGCPPTNVIAQVDLAALQPPVSYFVIFHSTPWGGLLPSLSTYLLFDSISLIDR